MKVRFMSFIDGKPNRLDTAGVLAGEAWDVANVPADTVESSGDQAISELASLFEAKLQTKVDVRYDRRYDQYQIRPTAFEEVDW